MSRFIDSDVLEKRLNSIVVTSDLFGMGISQGMKYAITEAKKLQSDDAEIVIRCRDCEHGEEADEDMKAEFPEATEFYCNHLDCPVDGIGFCSAGKRKKGY